MPFNSNIYSVDWPKLVSWLLPPELRRPKMLALSRALVSSLNDLHTRFGYYRSSVLYRIGITGQVCYLERALNDRYDLIERRIFITDGIEMEALPLYLKAENKPLILHRKSDDIAQILYTKSETSVFSADFVINIPITVPFDLAELTAFVKAYRIASKTFKINFI